MQGFRNFIEHAECVVADHIDPKIIAKASGLGFNVSKLWFHGSQKKFNKFKSRPTAGLHQELGDGTYLTSKIAWAKGWSRGGGYIYACFVKNGTLFDLNNVTAHLKEMEELDCRMMTAKFGADSCYRGKDYKAKVMQLISSGNMSGYVAKLGYLGAYQNTSQIPGQLVVFNPKNIFIAKSVPHDQACFS